MPYVSRRFFLALFIYANLISLFFISNHVPGYASDNHQICDQKDVSIKKLPLTASSLFANITKFPDDVENKRLEALKQGIQFKLIGNNEQARCFFETAALIDAPSAMHQLGMLGAHDKVDWFILAFQVHWIQTGKHLPVSCNALEALRSSDKRAAIFLNDLTKRYPENGNHIHNLYNKAVQFLESLEEHYLSEQERIEKAFRCFSAIKDENGYRELARLLFNNKMGRHFSEEEQAEQAVAYALRSNDPIYLRNAGIYYNIGKVGKNLSPEERSNKAFSCFFRC